MLMVMECAGPWLTNRSVILTNRSVILAQKLSAPVGKQIAENGTFGGRSYKMRLCLELSSRVEIKPRTSDVCARQALYC